MNDDELADALRSEVPSPAPDFWARMDDRLREVEDDPRQTDPNVIRLTDMHTTRDTVRSGTAWPFLVAAAALVLIAGGAFLLTRGGDSTDVDVAGEAEVTSTSAVDGDPTVTTVPPSNSDGSDGDGSEDAPVEALPDEAPAVWIVAGPDEAEARTDPAIGNPDIAYFPGLDALVTTGRRVSVDGAEWMEVDGGFDGPVLWFERSRLERVADLAESVEPGIVTVLGDGPVNIRFWPSLDGALVGQVGPDVTLPRTGRQAVADGLTWVELDGGEERPRSWIAADFVTFTDGEGLDAQGEGPDLTDCFADAEGNVLVIAFSEDVMTFTGAFRYLDSVEAVAGIRTVGTQFLVNVSPISSGEEDGGPIVSEEEWLSTGDGISIGERAFLEFIPCGDQNQVVGDITTLVGDQFPPFPTNGP